MSAPRGPSTTPAPTYGTSSTHERLRHHGGQENSVSDERVCHGRSLAVPERCSALGEIGQGTLRPLEFDLQFFDTGAVLLPRGLQHRVNGLGHVRV